MTVIANHHPNRRRTLMVWCTLALLLPGACPSTAAAAQPRSFATPEEAVQALAAAVQTNDTKALLAVLGEDAQPLISSGDPVADRIARERFMQSYEAANSVVKTDNGKAVLQIGNDNWPFPIPLVSSATGWHFDAIAGKEEILDRRIGANERSATLACLAYVDAQREYYQRNPDHAALLHYAQRLASSPGKRDGLYWDAKSDQEQSPLGPHFARARAEGYAGSGKGAPYHGYYFRILTAQGPGSSGGAYDYLAQGKMIGGFGLVAYPAKWDNSGVMTFIVNHEGVVYQKNLGRETAKAATAMASFDPDASWKKVE